MRAVLLAADAARCEVVGVAAATVCLRCVPNGSAPRERIATEATLCSALTGDSRRADEDEEPG